MATEDVGMAAFNVSSDFANVKHLDCMCPKHSFFSIFLSLFFSLSILELSWINPLTNNNVSSTQMPFVY